MKKILDRSQKLNDCESMTEETEQEISSIFAGAQGLTHLSDDEWVKLTDSFTKALAALNAEELIAVADIVNTLLKEIQA